MGQQASVAYSFCCTACSACPCCTRTEYEPIDKLGLMNSTQVDYQSNGTYDNAAEQKTAHHHADQRTKFRGFVIAYCKSYGYLLLKAYKKGKGEHHQLPGGHIDKSELHGRSFEEAARMAAKRELFEETGLQIDSERFKFLNFGIAKRAYFQLLLDEKDSLHNVNGYDVSQLNTSLNETQTDFYLKLSHEHNGFEFEKDIDKAIEMIQKHSGGKNSEALRVYAKKAKHERKRSGSHSYSKSKSKSTSDKRKKKKDKKKKQKNKKVDEDVEKTVNGKAVAANTVET